MVFFQGTLQEGIAAALHQDRSVVCFVTDGETESQQWENDFFEEEGVKTLLQTRAVSLRLEAGSQEEQFLAQLYPLPKKPTVVIIRNGQLKEYIAAGATKDDFVRRITASLATTTRPANESITTSAGSAQPQAEATPVPQPGQRNHSEGPSVGGSGPTIPPPSTGSLADGRAEEITQQEKNDGEANSKPTEDTTSKKSEEQQRHVEALKKKQREAREERERVLKAIEDDKVARKVEQAEQAAARRSSLVPETSSQTSSAPTTQKAKASDTCALQVRLFDGSTIRNRFPSSETLKDVRKWITETREDVDDGFTFKVLLTPLPSKTIAADDEDKTLLALKLTPSATLILHRVRSTFTVSSPFTPATTSAAGEPQGNVFQRLISLILAAVTGPFSTLFTFFSSLFSTSGPPPPASEPTSASQASGSQSRPTSDAARRRGGRVAGVDQTERRRDDQQFYNGNSTNFEPRSDNGE
ncbi:hypothetical protein B0J18DRAFT_96339 [Chaetomium sp. MPI-SDFR-AT-0129]|nr:hypothetical protein B0J18DRAFT_96339 [Chaetomium sp. MPI-SDFR-AT-0129]